MNYDAAIRPTTDGRPIDALIAAYAARTLSAPLTALVAAHLELKPDNRAYVAALEAAHGVFLADLRPVPLAGRDRRLVNIFASPEPPPRAAPASPVNDCEAMLPRALRRLAGCDDAGLRWRSRGSGVKEALLRNTEGSALFLSARPGKRLPISAAEGLTAALVLAGCAVDRGGDYRRGDIILIGEEAENDAAIAEGETDCVCFVAGEGPAQAPGPLRRVLNSMTGG